MELDGVKINGYTNTWSEIAKVNTYRLMENDEYGDETCYLVINSSFEVITETFDDIFTALHDCEIFPETECSYCNKNCVHRGCYRRLPKCIGGLSLCKNLQ